VNLKIRFNIKKQLTNAYSYGYLHGIHDATRFYESILEALKKKIADIEVISNYNSMELDKLRNKLKELGITITEDDVERITLQ